MHVLFFSQFFFVSYRWVSIKVNRISITLSHNEDAADGPRNYAHRFKHPPKALAEHVSSLGLAMIVLQHVGVVKLVQHKSQLGKKQHEKHHSTPPRSSKVGGKTSR